MVESPDIPWARTEDDHGRPVDFAHRPSEAAVFLKEFLERCGVKSGALLDVGCGNGRDSVFFAKHAFDVHAMDICSQPMEGIERYGVKKHNASATEYWLFENSSFDLVLDVCCYSEQEDEGKRATYRTELSRVLKPGGYFMVSVPIAFSSHVGKEFSDFEMVAEEEVEDRLMNYILRKR